MPAQQAVTPPKTPRGSRRRPRKSATTTPSHISSVQKEATPTVDPSCPKVFDQPTRILRRNEFDPVPDVNVVGDLKLPNPITPPRPRSMHDDLSNAQSQGNQSAPDTSQRRKKGRKSHGGITRASGVPRLDPNEAPMSKPLQHPLTPNRQNGTPVRAYAGPTFHASPAASSLPMPKFFSRSVPNVDKTSSLKSMMEQEAIETTSESDNSPFLEKSRLTQDRQARDQSPLDIFFQADRDAKAKSQNQNCSPEVSSSLQSELQSDVRHHSRQPTDSSLGGMFSLDMDGAPADKPDTKNDNETSSPIPKTMTDAEHRDEQRKAQTLELKKLLYSPESQRSASSSPYSGTPSKVLDSPSPKTTPHVGSPGLVPDGTSKEQQRYAALLALAQKQITGPGTSTNTASAIQRPPSSKLRKEISVPSSPGIQPPELPATPTQSHVQKISNSSNGHTQQQQIGYASPLSPFPSAFAPPAKPLSGFQGSPSRHSPDARTIEEDLRRILKLDVLGGDHVTGVRS